MDKKNHTEYLGNNETLKQGLFVQVNDQFLAMTLTQSKYFKTERGAINWLKKRGLDRYGKQL